MDKKNLFKNYISFQLGRAHNPGEFTKELKVTDRYFKKNYLKWLPKDKDAKIIDVACGMGHFLHFLQGQGYRNFTGIDISQEVASFCEKMNFPVETFDMFDFLETKTDFYDVVVFNDIIEHLNKKEILIILGLIYKALKPGGVLCIKTLNMANIFTATGGRYIDFTHQTCFTEESLRQACYLSDFKDIHISGLNIYIFYLNPLNYIAWLISKILNFMMKCLTRIYGRKTLTIFTKNLLAVCRKEENENQ